MKILIVDGFSIMFRAFYGVAPLTTKDGRFTNAIFGFLNILLSLLDRTQPDSVAICFDSHEKTFRHKIYSEYKGTRSAAPAEFLEQVPILKDLLDAMGYKFTELPGYEADDLIGTITRCAGNDDMCYIATGDRDSLQLVKNNVHVLLTTTKSGRTESVEYDEALVLEKKGVTPRELIDVKALMGDSSDNIPGVAGIGEKTATALISGYKNIDYIYEHIDEINVKPSVREKLKKGRDMAYLSRELGTICLDAPINASPSSFIPSEPDKKRVKSILASLEMYKFIERLGLTDIEIKQETISAEKCEYKGECLISELVSLFPECKKFYIYAEQGSDMCAIGDGSVFCLTKLTEIAPILKDESIEKCVNDSKLLYTEFYKTGAVSGISFDTLLAGYILNPDCSDYSVAALCGAYGVSYGLDGEIPQLAIKASALKTLEAVLTRKLKENNQLELLSEMEIPLAEVLVCMEQEGFLVCREGIAEFSDMLEARINQLTEQIYNQAGEKFNINSPKQLGVILFEKLGLPVRKKTKTGYSTNAEVLESLTSYHPIVGEILEYRSLAKLKSTYCDGLLNVIGADGRVRSTFNQTETRTGRLSSSEPNLQNIPVRTELGSEMRKFFVAKDGCILVDADYSQIELRVLAHISGDSNMTSAFINGDDIHTITASQVFDMPVDMISPLMRTRAKAVNFGIVYGISAFSLAKDIGVSRSEADAYIKSYLSHYSGVNEYMNSTITSAKESGYVSTMFGRRRYLPELTSTNATVRGFGERVARNMPIQGTAADIIKIAMVNVYRRLKSEDLKAKLIMQVHDELIIEAPVEEADAVTALLKEEMEGAVLLSVPLTVDVHTGKTWYEAKG